MGRRRRSAQPQQRYVGGHPSAPAEPCRRQGLSRLHRAENAADQTFLATEFSLVLFFQSHLQDPITAQFANRYHLPKATQAWQVIHDALGNPFMQQKWDDFLAMSPWFATNKNYLADQMNSFRGTGKLAVATYGIGQDGAMSGKSFGPTSQPWLLNSVFCQHPVQPAANGLPGQNTVWANGFRSQQHS